VEKLNSLCRQERYAAIDQIRSNLQSLSEGVCKTEEVNNHVHTIYSFSPYSPAMSALKAFKAGLKTVGIMDHDSVSGCAEMIAACKELEMASTVGCEVRVNFKGTTVEGLKTNNPDSHNISYIAIHGIPVGRIAEVDTFLKPLRTERNKRNRAEVEKLNELIVPTGLQEIDFEKDVYCQSQAAEGGSITERHILYALTEKIIAETGKGRSLVDFARNKLGIEITGQLEEFLLDEENSHYHYDLLGVMKGSFLEKIFSSHIWSAPRMQGKS